MNVYKAGQIRRRRGVNYRDNGCNDAVCKNSSELMMIDD